MTNTLYYGDNLEILRRYIKDESVNLIYLDQPFNSNAYMPPIHRQGNVTFKKAPRQKSTPGQGKLDI